MRSHGDPFNAVQALVAVYKSLLEFYKVAHEMLTRKGMALTLAVLSNSGPLPDAIQTFLGHATTLHKVVSKATLEIVQDIKRLLCDQESTLKPSKSAPFRN